MNCDSPTEHDNNISIGNIFILCEGNFGHSNATLWIIDEQGNVFEGPNNPIGDIGQSMIIDNDHLFVINNGTSTIEIYVIMENASISYLQSVNMKSSGPREMAILNGKGYITEWNTSSIAILDLETFALEGTISVGGMPEDIFSDGTYLYISIIQGSDWSPSNIIQVIDPSTEGIINNFSVGYGPGQMVLSGDNLYVTNIRYNDNWEIYTGTSRINLVTEEALIVDHGLSSTVNADIVIINNNIYRIWGNGIVQLDDDLNIIEGSTIGDYSGLYSMAFFDEKIFLGLSDYSAPDEVIVLDINGNELGSHQVGAIPGSFAFY